MFSKWRCIEAVNYLDLICLKKGTPLVMRKRSVYEFSKQKMTD